MTDIDPDAAARRPSLSRMTQIAAATVSLALIAGISVWGYRLIERDVHGVPVVQAAEGAARIQPEAPGGRPAAHQGLAVNEVAGAGTAAPPPAQVRLAAAPVTLTEEDLPQGDLAARAETGATDDAAPASSGALRALADQIAGADAPALSLDAIEEVSAPAGRTEAGTAAASAPAVPDTTAALAEAMAMDAESAAAPGGAKTIAARSGVPARSLRPTVRPAVLRVAARGAEVPAPAARPVPEADPENLPAGTRLVQLGAFESAEVARSEWERLDGRFAAYLGGKTRVVQRAESGGRTFWRLRAMGFEDLADARRFCAALTAEGADCIPVVTR
jgi:hypothetical protein